MIISRILINKEEEKEIEELRKKLKKKGFRLDDKFDRYIHPIQGTLIKKMYGEETILYIQEKY